MEKAVYRLVFLQFVAASFVFLIAGCAQPSKNSLEQKSNPSFLKEPRHSIIESRERPPIFTASSLLPPEILSNPAYTIDEQVNNDGLNNHYRLRSRYGDFKVGSTADLKTLTAETKALNQLEILMATTAYQNAQVTIKSGLSQKSAKPFSSNISSQFDLLKSVGHSIFGNSRQLSDGDLETLQQLSGVKRNFASQLGIDPYTDNQLIQQRLNKISWVIVAGGLNSAKVLVETNLQTDRQSAITNFRDLVWQELRDLSPSELRKTNADKLKKMFVRREIASEFLNHPFYSLTVKTLIIAALGDLDDIVDRETFFQSAAHGLDASSGWFHYRQAAMIRSYHRNVSAVERIFFIGNAPFLLTRKSIVVGVFPFDHIAWTEQIAILIDGSTAEAIKSFSGVKGIELHFSGTVSSLARQALETHGWKVVEKATNQSI